MSYTDDDRFALEDASIGSVALTVQDLDAMVAFYRDVVGLSVQSRDEARATLGVDDPMLVLDRDPDAQPREPAQAGLFHTAFRLPSRAALGAAIERVRAHWHLDGASDHFVSEALYLADPEDNGVEIYVDRPREEWPRAADGTIEMGTVRLALDDVVAASDGADSAPPGTDVGHVHLETTSLSDARAFYVDALGLGVQTGGPSALFLAAGDYHHHVGVNTWNGRTAPTGDRGLAWFELVVPDEATLGRVRRRVDEADVPVRDRPDAFEVTAPDEIRLRVRSA